MKVVFFDTHSFEKDVFQKENEYFHHQIDYLETRLSQKTAFLASGYSCICVFVNDLVSRPILEILSDGGTHLLALRSAGFNHVDLNAAMELKIKVVRVPDYSPYAVAEHAVALALTLNRKTHRAFNRVREGNFSLNGLVGFDFHGKTVGVIGTGKIGKAFSQIMHGFGCNLLLNDVSPDLEFEKQLGARYTSLEELLTKADIISLHVPLTPETKHLISTSSIQKMKPSVMIINTGRGRLIDTKALIQGLKSGQIGNAGLDVYEEEEGIFFQDHSGEIISDDLFTRLMTFPNVLITGHQAFLTQEALINIARTTLKNIQDFEFNRKLINEVVL